MRARDRFAIAAALVLGLAGTARADSDEMSGTVIRRQGIVLELQDGAGKLVKVRTDGQTEFRGPEGAKLAMADIDKGAYVRVKLSPNTTEGERVAREVSVEPVRTDTSRSHGTKPDMRAIPHNPQRSPGEASGIVP
jgi:hypothetical protein